MALVVKSPSANAGDVRDAALIPGSGRSPGEGTGNPLQYSCLGNPMDRGAWRLQSMGSQRVGSNLACTQGIGKKKFFIVQNSQHNIKYLWYSNIYLVFIPGSWLSAPKTQAISRVLSVLCVLMNTGDWRQHGFRAGVVSRKRRLYWGPELSVWPATSRKGRGAGDQWLSQPHEVMKPP